MPGPQVDVWIDPICPFCYVAVERAAWLRERFDADVRLHPFDLHPEYPPEGIPRDEVTRRYGPRAHDYVREFFERHGLEHNPPPTRVPSSRKALQLTELARDRGLHEPFHDRLMDAMWAEATDIGDHDELRRLAREVGLDGGEVDEVLAGDAYVERIAASTREAQAVGVNGIPAFVLDGRLLLLGAQPPEVFEQAFAQLDAA